MQSTIGPEKRPLSSITPTIIEKDSKFEIAIGGSGGSMIPTATLNVSKYQHCYEVITKRLCRALLTCLIMERISILPLLLLASIIN